MCEGESRNIKKKIEHTQERKYVNGISKKAIKCFFFIISKVDRPK